MNKNKITLKFLGISVLVFLFSFTPVMIVFGQTTDSTGRALTSDDLNNAQKITLPLADDNGDLEAIVRRDGAGTQTEKNYNLKDLDCTKTDFYAYYVEDLKKFSEYWTNPNITFTFPPGYTVDDFKKAFRDELGENKVIQIQVI